MGYNQRNPVLTGDLPVNVAVSYRERVLDLYQSCVALYINMQQSLHREPVDAFYAHLGGLIMLMRGSQSFKVNVGALWYEYINIPHIMGVDMPAEEPEKIVLLGNKVFNEIQKSSILDMRFAEDIPDTMTPEEAAAEAKKNYLAKLEVKEVEEE